LPKTGTKRDRPERYLYFNDRVELKLKGQIGEVKGTDGEVKRTDGEVKGKGVDEKAWTGSSPQPRYI
jgi:hypothetical protein